MKYILNRYRDYQLYIDTALTKVDGNVELNQHKFDDATGIGEVNYGGEGSVPFRLLIPLNNLKRGNKIVLEADIKVISGALPEIGSYLNRVDTNSGSAGFTRFRKTPTGNIDGFERVKLEFIYEGRLRSNSSHPVDNNYDGMMYVGIVCSPISKYKGASHFQYKNVTVETESPISGFTPATRAYYGLATLTADTFEINDGRGSHNFTDLTLSKAAAVITINFKSPYLAPPMVMVVESYQSGGNNNKYQVKLNTSTAGKVDLMLFDRIANTYVTSLAEIDRTVYFSFMIIGE